MLRRLDNKNRKHFVCFADWSIRIGNASLCFGDCTIRIGNPSCASAIGRTESETLRVIRGLDNKNRKRFVWFCDNLSKSAVATIDFILYLHLDGERTAWKNQ